MNTLMKTVSSFLKSSTSFNKTETMETAEKTILERTIKVARTKTGAPCLWESYSEFDNGLIRSTIIIDTDGNIKNSVFLKNAKNKQALVPIQEGDIIVKAFRDNIGIAISLLEIQSLSTAKNEAQILPIYRKASDVLNLQAPEKYTDAIMEATKKLDNSDMICCTLTDK